MEQMRAVAMHAHAVGIDEIRGVAADMFAPVDDMHGESGLGQRACIDRTGKPRADHQDRRHLRVPPHAAHRAFVPCSEANCTICSAARRMVKSGVRACQAASVRANASAGSASTASTASTIRSLWKSKL